MSKGQGPLERWTAPPFYSFKGEGSGREIDRKKDRERERVKADPAVPVATAGVVARHTFRAK